MNFSFRARLIALITLTVAACVALVAWQVESNLRRSFELAEQSRTAALVQQFSQGFEKGGDEIAKQVEAIANSEAVLRIALATDASGFVNEAQTLAATHQLDLLEILSADGTIISSAQWPARFGYKETWTSEFDSAHPRAKSFLKREQLPDSEEIAIVAVRTASARGNTLLLVGGQKLDARYFHSFNAPSGLRPMLYRYRSDDISASNFLSSEGAQKDQDAQHPELRSTEKIAPYLEEIRKSHPAPPAAGWTRTIQWTSNPEDAETVHATPMVGRNNELLGVLLVAAPMREQIRLARHVRNVALAVGGAGILFGTLLSLWMSSRITRPLEQLAAAATEVARGHWDTHVAVTSNDEIGQLAAAFNHMTHELIAQREQLVQTERVAAWRELARRLAHELKNPLFPLQITVENLLRARETSPAQFDEVFRESTTTLLAELSNLKTIVGRFSDFSKMPVPQLQATDVNLLLREAVQLFQAQFSRSPEMKVTWSLAEELPKVNADPVLLRRAVENLVLNALDAMPSGGTITFRSSLNHAEERVVVEVSDSGSGLTPEECERLFTPYYTTKQFGTGLGLAIVQSVVADHGGTISVSSEKNAGTTFHIELPLRGKDAVT